MSIRLLGVLLWVLDGAAASTATQRPSYYSALYGIKYSYPQLLAVSWTYLSVEDPQLRFKPFVQVEPGIFGGKFSGGFGSVAGFPIMTSVRVKAAYLHMWAGSVEGWKSRYGYLGPEIEFMTILPSVHLGVYHSLGETLSSESLRFSIGGGVGF